MRIGKYDDDEKVQGMKSEFISVHFSGLTYGQGDLKLAGGGSDKLGNTDQGSIDLKIYHVSL